MSWEARQYRPSGSNNATSTGNDQPLSKSILELAAQQEATWPQLKEAVAQWFDSRSREIRLGPFSVLLQYNPAREPSVAALVDPVSISRRPCFLCEVNLPPEERGIALTPDYTLFLNPFPILYPHPVIIHREHRPQQATPETLATTLATARRLEGEYTMLYNGPSCGASAPDHLHLQAIPRFHLPSEADIQGVEKQAYFQHLKQVFAAGPDLDAWTIRRYDRAVLVMSSPQETILIEAFQQVLAGLARRFPADGEPMVNFLCWYTRTRWTLCLFPRRRHRPTNYSREGAGVLVSPGAMDLGGLIITPRRVDFERLDDAAVRQIFAEVSITDVELADLAREAIPDISIGRAVKAGVRQHRSNQARLAEPDGIIQAEEVGGIIRAKLSGSASSVESQPTWISQSEPVLRVGLAEGCPSVEFTLTGPWETNGVELAAGNYRAEHDGQGVIIRQTCSDMCWRGNPVIFSARNRTASRFTLQRMAFGLEFHWQREEDLTFPGDLELIAGSGGTITAINQVPLETYLECVVSSEMRPTAPDEFLCAHAVISRSWLLAQLAGREADTDISPAELPSMPWARLSWTDRQRHGGFDVCADDHCQRYQGLTRISSPQVARTIAATRGLVLLADGVVCDARFSKCCGGMSESFRTAWGDFNPPGIEPVRDGPAGSDTLNPLSIEANAEQWIRANPLAYCNVQDQAVLRRILPDFDLETTHFFRWTFTAQRTDLEQWIHAKTGWDPGVLTGIVPVQRGHSGRLARVLLVGTSGRFLLGKELEIRRALSASHLYSSAFVVEPLGARDGVPEAFQFNGAGWGHGVGLCQIGAAAMACQSADHRQILAHYFPGTRLAKVYE